LAPAACQSDQFRDLIKFEAEDTQREDWLSVFQLARETFNKEEQE